jgi:hypothetical protein
MAAAGQRTALLIVRAWVEPDADPPALRVRITATHDLAAIADTPSVSMAADVDVVCERVRAWLQTFVDGEPARPTAPGRPVEPEDADHER